MKPANPDAIAKRLFLIMLVASIFFVAITLTAPNL